MFCFSGCSNFCVTYSCRFLLDTNCLSICLLRSSFSSASQASIRCKKICHQASTGQTTRRTGQLTMTQQKQTNRPCGRGWRPPMRRRPAKRPRPRGAPCAMIPRPPRWGKKRSVQRKILRLWRSSWQKKPRV